MVAAGFRIAESGAHALGCPVFPAGIGNTEQRVSPTMVTDTLAFTDIAAGAFHTCALGTGEELPASLPKLFFCQDEHDEADVVTREIKRLNGLDDAIVHPGQRLTLPPAP